jgi:hypothetical protein
MSSHSDTFDSLPNTQTPNNLLVNDAVIASPSLVVHQILCVLHQSVQALPLLFPQVGLLPIISPTNAVDQVVDDCYELVDKCH